MVTRIGQPIGPYAVAWVGSRLKSLFIQLGWESTMPDVACFV